MAVEFYQAIQEKILSYLDGWIIDDSTVKDNLTTNYFLEEETEDGTENTNDCECVEPFITSLSDYKGTPNKRVSCYEVESTYNSCLNKAYSYLNRLNVDDLTSVEQDLFIEGVCMWTASDLWNKYNIRVNNEDMEDTYIQSYGGLLYKQAITTLKPFIVQRVVTGIQLREKLENKQNTAINDKFWWM